MGAARRNKRKKMMELYRVTKKIKMKTPETTVKDAIQQAKEKLKNKEI